MKYVYALLFSVLLVSCASNSPAKVDSPQYEALKKQVNSKKIAIESRIAYPMNSSGLTSVSNNGLLGRGNAATAINLADNANFVKIDGNSIALHLPYFGNRTNWSYKEKDNSISYKGAISQFRTKEKKKQIDIYFTFKKGIEEFTARIILYPNRTSRIEIQSSHRSTIAYRGNLI